MKTLIALALTSLLTLMFGSSARGDQATDFDSKVATILAGRCLDCHSGPDAKGKLDLSRRDSAFRGGKEGPAIVAGKPDESPLYTRVESGDMPPKAALPEEESAILRGWIASGAAWGTDPIDAFQFTTQRRAGRDWWSLRPVVRPEVPPGPDPSPIDRFVRAKLEANGLGLAPEADRRSLLRRVTFDLTGLPPTPQEVDAFLADPAANAYEKVVDRLLASPQFGVRWARWWLDLARFGESHGYEYDEFRPDAWRYRDWVVNAFNADLPYDEFARLQMAGDVLNPNDPAHVEATGFLVAGAYDTVGQNQVSQVMRAKVRADELEDVVGTVSQAFLGLTVHCARCHDHKFDPIRQAEYYQMASALSGVRQGTRDLSGIDPELVAMERRIEDLNRQVKAIEAPVRERSTSGPSPIATLNPIAAWDFDRSLDDAIGSVKLTLEGGATLTPEGLKLDGKTGYAISGPLTQGLRARTIEAWVKLDKLDQRGGGVVSIQSTEAPLPFDAIVYGEQESNRWLAGSDGFLRTRRFGGEPEQDATQRPVHVAISYEDNGSIRAFRDGQPYGNPYKSGGPIAFAADRAQVLFGMRHQPAGGNRMLAGTILRARLYDHALSPAEVAASASTSGAFLSPAALAESLPADLRAERTRLLAEIRRTRETRAGQVHQAYAVVPRESGAMRINLRGNPGQPGDEVTAGGVAAVQGLGADFGLKADAPEATRRQQLAGWITSPANPLFARVVVNRLWQAHFGSGLVETSSDLGFNGGTASHPELLDWLAAEIRDQGWSLKALHRRMVLSATYRQSSRLDPVAVAKDAGNRWLWRKSPTRLEAEMVRDAMLAVSGRLDAHVGGPSFLDRSISKAEGTPSILYVATDPSKPGLDRRTLYRAWTRGGRSSLLDAFDCPDPSATSPRRAVTTTPLQALAMMNNALVLFLSDRFADRLTQEAGADAGRQVDQAFRLAYGRTPEASERETCVRVIEQFGAATLARALFNSGEFSYLD